MEKSNIAWTDDTINFWSGCTKVSAGCANCYAEALANRFDTFGKWGKGKPRQRHQSAFNLAKKLNKKPFVCDKCGDAVASPPRAEGAWCSCGSDSGYHTRRIFTLSLGDIMDEDVSVELRSEAFDTIRVCSNVTWILCSKRWHLFWTLMEEMQDYDFDHGKRELCGWLRDWRKGDSIPQNIILLASVENQEQADKRIPELLKIPSACSGLSIEPLIGDIDLKLKVFEQVEENSRKSFVDWIILGGESGSNARACNVAWIRSLVEQGKGANVATFVKQLGANVWDAPIMPYKWEGLKDKKGGDIAEFPADLQIRQFPKGF